MSADYIATARRELQEAEQRHRAAEGKARSVADRIEVVKAQQVAITNRRIRGEANEADAAEFAALAGDLEALKGMLATATADAATHQPAVDEARNRLSMAERQHERDVVQAEFQALADTATKLENALTACIGQLHQHGKRLGYVGLSQSWRPGQPLYKAIHYGVAPEA